MTGTSAGHPVWTQPNSLAGVSKRDYKQIKKCWENITSRANKSIAKQKREAKLTPTWWYGLIGKRRRSRSRCFNNSRSNDYSLDNAFDDDNYEAGKRFCRIERILSIA